MKQSFLIILVFMSIISSAASCHKNDLPIRTESNAENNLKDEIMTPTKIRIKVGSKTFTATLLENKTAQAFKEILPLTMNLTEMNGDEKYGYLLKSLPTNASNPGTTKKGDLMLFGSKTLVLFYQTRSTSYRYTKLGTVDDVVGLAEALGSGNVTVAFELE